MFEFYSENLKYYLQIAFYRYIPHLILALFLFIFISLVLGGVLFLKPDLANLQIMKIVVVSIAVSPLVIGISMLLIFLLKFIFITGYSVGKYQEESGIRVHLIFRIFQKMTSPKLLVLALFIFIIGYVIYNRILVQIVPLAEINAVVFSLALTLFIYSVVVLLFVTRHFVISLIKALWEYLPGLLWKCLVALVLILSQLVLLAAIYLVVSAFLVPMLPIPS